MKDFIVESPHQNQGSSTGASAAPVTPDTGNDTAEGNATTANSDAVMTAGRLIAMQQRLIAMQPRWQQCNKSMERGSS
jgi:hypothetical protein